MNKLLMGVATLFGSICTANAGSLIEEGEYRRLMATDLGAAAKSVKVTAFGDPCIHSLVPSKFMVGDRLVVLMEMQTSIAQVSCPPEFFSESVDLGAETGATLYVPKGTRVSIE